MPRKKTVTLRHIADRLGLTVHTVSKALRGLPGMAEATRREVLAAAREMGYVTKAQEAGLTAERISYAAGKPRRFTLFVGERQTYFRVRFLGLHHRLQELGHTIHTIELPADLSDERSMTDWLEQIGVLYADGVFLTPGLPEWQEAVILKQRLPKVLINYPPDSQEVDSVVWDVQHAVHIAVDVLCRAGHRDILYVGDIESQRGFRLRRLAFAKAMSRNGLDERRAGYIGGGTRNRIDWLGQLEAELCSGRYSIVLAVQPGEAEWVLHVARQAGIRVPQELSVIGMENESLEACPGLTRPTLRVQEAGERAAELMLRRIANPHLPYEHVRLIGAMYEGETMGPPRPSMPPMLEISSFPPAHSSGYNFGTA